MRYKLAKGLLIALISFVIFNFIFSAVRLDSYIFVFSMVMLTIYIAFFNSANMEMILRTGAAGFYFSCGYLLAKLLSGNVYVGDRHPASVIRIVFGVLVAAEYVIWALCLIRLRIGNHKTACADCRETLFPERKNDLERLEQYLAAVDVVGIHGSWGNGKTFLVDCYVKDHAAEYEVIKAEPLTCNLDTIDAYLFHQLDNVLWRNHVYPRYSRKLQNAIAENTWVKQLGNLIFPGDADQLTVF